MQQRNAQPEPTLQDAVQLHQAGALDRAAAIYQRVLQREPQSADALHLLGVVAYQRGDCDDAVRLIEQAIALLPGSAAFHNNLGSARLELSQTESALECFRHASSLDPNFVDAWYNLGNVLQKTGRLTEAVDAYRHALGLVPENITALTNLGAVLQTLNKFADAVDCYRKVLALDPRHAIAWHNLGLCLDVQNDLSEAEACFRRALEIRPDYADAYNSLGSALRTQGRVAEARDCFERVLRLDPGHRLAQSNVLLALDYLHDVTPREIYERRCAWGDRVGTEIPITARHDNLAIVDRPLRVGYVSPDLREHAVASFLEPILRSHSEQIEVYCYADVPAPDQVTERLQGLAGHWRNIYGGTDEQVAAQIREDHIDVLVDLAGHTARNRLYLFARKPAPIQISYLGDATTSGLAAMDYRLTDAWADPWFAEDHCREDLVRLPAGFICFQPPAAAPDVDQLPKARNGFVTFGCFNSMAKISSVVVGIWAKLLCAVPDSRLLLKAGPLRDAQVRERLLEQFRTCGVAADRLELRAQVIDAAEHLSLYHQVDIGLDPYPYAGTTTTCEALWMGVPVVTLSGETHVSRVGVSLLSRLGLNELVAQNEQEYINIAASLAADDLRLSKIRTGLRTAMRNSTICRAESFTQQLEAAYRDMWSRWCQSSLQFIEKAG